VGRFLLWSVAPGFAQVTSQALLGTGLLTVLPAPSFVFSQILCERESWHDDDSSHLMMPLRNSALCHYITVFDKELAGYWEKQEINMSPT